MVNNDAKAGTLAERTDHDMLACAPAHAPKNNDSSWIVQGVVQQ